MFDDQVERGDGETRAAVDPAVFGGADGQALFGGTSGHAVFGGTDGHALLGRDLADAPLRRRRAAVPHVGDDNPAGAADDDRDDDDALADKAPSLDLVALLERLEVDELDDFEVVEVVAAWRRVGAWAAARAARAAATLAARESMNPPWPESAGTVTEPGVAGDELALRLACSRTAARSLVRGGLAFERALWPTGDALEAGRIDEGKADVLVRALADVPEELAWQVQGAVLPQADRRTRRQLAADVERALIAIDPQTADARAQEAVAGRRISRPQMRPDGMVALWAVLPAPAGLALNSRLEAVARRVRQAGDGRTVEQLRADILCAAVLNPIGPCTDHHPAHEGAGALSRVEGAPATGDGVGVSLDAGAVVPDDLAPLLDWIAGTPLRTELRVTVPLDTLLVDAPMPAELVSREGPLPTGGPGPSEDADLSDASVEVLRPPPDLIGYGPIAPATARALARDGTWRRLVTDPLSSALLDVGRSRYRPPADLDEFIRLRDDACVRPGCSVPTTSCDLDHTVPYGDPDAPGPHAPGLHAPGSSALGSSVPGSSAPGSSAPRPHAPGSSAPGATTAPSDRAGSDAVPWAPGTTSHDNLAPLCRTDHRLKTHAGFRLEQVAPGVFEWLTPTGHR